MTFFKRLASVLARYIWDKSLLVTLVSEQFISSTAEHKSPRCTSWIVQSCIEGSKHIDDIVAISSKVSSIPTIATTNDIMINQIINRF